MLIGSKLSEPQVHRIARNLFSASVRMKELLDEFLTRYRGTDRGVEPADLRELITSAVDKVALVAEAQSVQIVQNVPGNLVITAGPSAHPSELSSISLVNALDVMPGGGTIRISAIPERHSVLIKVRDTGPGIAPEIRDRLFQPFVDRGQAGRPRPGPCFFTAGRARSWRTDVGGIGQSGRLLCVLFAEHREAGDAIRTGARWLGPPDPGLRRAGRAELSAVIP